MARKRARKRAAKKVTTALPYAYGIGPNELSEASAKRMGLKEFRRIAVSAGAFGHKVTAKQDMSGTWRITVGCETKTLTQWEKEGKGDIEQQYEFTGDVNEVTAADATPDVATPEVDYVNGIEFNFTDGESVTVEWEELDSETQEELRELALQGHLGSDIDENDDSEPRRARLWATLQAVIAELKAL